MPEAPKVLSRQLVAESRIFRVEQVDLAFSNGEQRSYERLLGGKRGSVLVVPLLDDDTVLLIREYATGSHDYQLGLPKGRMEADDRDPLQAADRELREEVGYGAGDLQLVKTRNGMLPLMDLFITLGKSGYADSFGSSFTDLDGDSYDALAGLRIQYPFFNREAKARHRRAQLDLDQAEKSLENLSQLVEVDVRTAYIEVNRAKQQIDASSATRVFNEEKLRIENEKFRVGKSTNFLVSQAQRDLLVSRIAEVEAVANYLLSLIDLYRRHSSNKPD